MLTRHGLRFIATFWIVVLVAVSLQPVRPNGEPESIFHPVWHVLVFGVAGLMLFSLSRNAKESWIAALWVFCLAVAIEISQHLLYRNVFEWWDVRDDTIGLVLAAMLIRWTRISSLLLKASD
jgi:VanZ family protein